MEQITKRFMNWASILEDNTRAQVQMTSEMPFIHPHVALMPDAHLGKGCAVGAVLPTLGAIMPAAVGVDIGCGMIAVRTQYRAADLPADRKPLREAIEAAVPLSAGVYNTMITRDHTLERIADLSTRAESAHFDPADYAANWRFQLGTLGSGNHFIEVSLDEDDRVWLFLHSGSRGVGNKIATTHIKVAQRQCAKRWIHLPDPDLAYLVEGDPEFWAYIRELRWAQHFALLNREEMMDRVAACFEEWVGGEVEESKRINCHHNYTEQETHFGKTVWLSRKGAIDASEGKLGLIPGSMGTRSYVVEGKGNRLALNSSPHGAGREYGRRHAQRTFTYEQLVESMEGIEWSGSREFIDEIPSAYKDIDVVMDDAADLVEVRHTLRQIVNVKGD
jgi:tRNA-splicing ligase RtcB (3'-phosphate/5'-hydroxy nucleic acid ligase)